ncbi:protein-glutamine gamma-glutamyltransferase 2 isoform X1 [Brachyistius frenatus]|uniref:protein-glutamine gamma-glutamyltransferase 2 isoform X1 n=1 Tax=Brachyistius frenatus TaxID=100188 RepID=UPI0037E97918
MAAVEKQSIFKSVDVHSSTNNTEHRTVEISTTRLIVRRGRSFTLTVRLNQPFHAGRQALAFTATTGQHPSEDLGTESFFGIPDVAPRSPSAKAVWKAELRQSSSPLIGVLILGVTPHADAPVGEYKLSARLGDDDTVLADLVVLFNAWCPDDWVFLADEDQRNEYVLNEQGVIYQGSGNYISQTTWDFGQFEDEMVNICMKVLDQNHKHLDDPANDVSARCNPIYVSRVVSAMINCEDDRGVLQGCWDSSFFGGYSPSHWSGSYAILRRWLYSGCRPVKYGQCWVFAGVMCSVMRLLGIPCRVVTNYQSAHDNNRNLSIDVYHADYGVREKESKDSVWNFHVWVEGWMRRPDMAKDGKYDGWQVLDPTPQEKSENVYCCGPASVNAILNGETHLKYDIPFVFAEVNADCVDWLIKADGSKVKIFSDSKRVGQNISTKSVGSNKRLNITDTYKHQEGSEKERTVFKYALTRDYSRAEEDGGTEDEGTEDEVEDEVENEVEDGGTEDEVEDGGTDGNEVNGTAEEVVHPPSKVSLRFEEVSTPTDGKDVSLKLVMRSDSAVARPLSVNISVQAMRYNGSPAATIQTEATEATLLPGKDLSVPVLVPFSSYHKHMVFCESMKVSAMVADKRDPANAYLAVDDVVLRDPPISVTVSGETRVNREVNVEVTFTNPIQETLRNCSLTLSGSGLIRHTQYSLSDMKPNTRIRIALFFVPYKSGEKTLVADFDCSSFRDIKGSCTVDIKP